MKITLFIFATFFVTTACSKTPAPEPAIALPATSVRAALGQPTKLALGYEHSCALFSSGQVMCWGSSTGSQLGEIDGKKIRSTIPHVLPFVIDGVDIDSFADQTCVLRKTGTVICFGSDGATKKIRSIAGVRDAKRVAVGKNTACANNEKELWCWGKSKGGQIPGTFDVRTTAAVKLEQNYENIIGSSSSFFGRNKSGWEGWGENRNNLFRTNAYKLNGFTKIPNTSNFAGIVSRADVTCGWNSDTVECWAETMKGNDSILKPTGIEGAIQKVVLGDEFACAMADKKVFCWGGNKQGTLGDGTRQGRPNAKAVEGMDDVIDIDAGDSHVCVIANQKVYCWGNSRSSQLGIDSRLVKTEPAVLEFIGMEGKTF